MNRYVLASVSLAFLAACQGGETTSSDRAPGPTVAPSFLISDAAHGGGTAQFFFLPPMVASATTVGAFNPNLSPTVSICPWVETPAGHCSSSATDYPNVPVNSGKYMLNWTVPNDPQILYRIRVFVGDHQLGFADVYTAGSAKDLKNVDKSLYVTQTDGSTLPIKFHIGEFALCPVPGQGPCSSEAVDLGEGGEVVLGTAGVDIPPQDPDDPTVVVTVSTCPDLNPHYIDLPVFGSCIHIETTPALPEGGLDNPATVFICDLAPDLSGVSEAREKYITLHRRDGEVVRALPHVPGCAIGSGAVSFSVKGMLASLLHGRFKDAGRQVLSLIGPKTLYARSMRLDEGGGGSTDGFSDFQFVEPAKMDIVAASNNQTAAPGSPLPTDPTVLVTDLGGNAVPNATVNFGPADGTLGAASALTDGDGHAHVSWQIIAGINHATVSGRGIAVPDHDGPRSGFDPYMVLQNGQLGVLNPFGDDIPPGPAVPFQLPLLPPYGLTFTAIGGAVDGFDFGAPGYGYLTDVKNDAHITYFGTARNSESGDLAGTQLGTVDVPAGWYLPAFAPTGWGTGQAAFGSGSVCSDLAAAVNTPWALNTDILVRKSFFTTSAGSVTITVNADNDAQIWLDGVNITKLAAATGYGHVELGSSGDADDWFVHGNCADLGPPVITIAVAAGGHTLALRGDDYGVQGHLDAKVVFTPAP